MRKRRTREHVIADLSVNHVERHVLRCGWTAERTRHDYGFDLLVETFDAEGEVQNGKIMIQAKATDHLRFDAGGATMRVRLAWRDLLFWLNEPLPVILVCYDAQRDIAYWLHVQDYFRKRSWERRSGGTVTVPIPATNILDEPAVRQFGVFRDDCQRSGGGHP